MLPSATPTANVVYKLQIGDDGAYYARNRSFRYTALLIFSLIAVLAIYGGSLFTDIFIATDIEEKGFRRIQGSSDIFKLTFKSRRLRNRKGKSEALFSIDALGTNSFVHNRTIFGAMLTTNLHDHRWDQSSVEKEPLLAAAAAQASASVPNMKSIAHLLPFPVIEWPHIITNACPSHRFEQQAPSHPRAVVAYDHYQIWLDFIFFDHDVLQAVNRSEVKDVLYNSTFWSSFSGIYAASRDGSLYKNGLPFYDDDIMVIMEDNVHVAVSNASQSLKAELSSMTTDLLYLGWRGKTAGKNIVFSYAYAITRRGARLAVNYFDPCKPDVDHQLSNMVKRNWLTSRKASPANFEQKNSTDTKKYGDTQGIFLQISS